MPTPAARRRWTSARLLAAAILAAFVMPGAAAAQRQAAEAPPPATLPNTHVSVLRSAINGREYHIAVALPINYQAADTTRYPVLYLLDGGAHLPLFASMFRVTNRAGRTGDVIMVGIGYYPPQAFPRPVPGQVAARNVDYSPPRFQAPGVERRDTTAMPWPARADAFHRVLKEEIIPQIERAYRTNGDRALHGHSLGGLFASYVLFEDPDLFSRYAIVSPAYGWDGESMFLRERRFRAGRTGLPKQVYIAVGGLEGPAMVGYMWRMTSALCAGMKDGPYRDLNLTAEVVPDEHHNSAVLFGRVLKAFYPPYPPAARQDACTAR